MKRFVIAAAVAASVWATPSLAVLTTFASYQQVFGGAGVTYNATTKTLTNNSNNLVSIDIFGDGSPAFNAIFTLNATTTSSTINAGGLKVLGGFNGLFTYKFAQDTTILGTTYSAGTNIFSASFLNGALSGSSTSGSFIGAASTADGTAGQITFANSNLLTFDNQGPERDFALTVTQALTSGNTSGFAGNINSFSAVTTGSFSSDPAPTVNTATPEAATWAMMLIGFGAIGGTVRSRSARRIPALAA